MSEKRKAKKSDIKIYIIFGVVMYICMTAGFLMGRIGFSLQDKIDSINWVDIANILYLPSAIIFAVVVLIVYGISFMFYISSKKHYTMLMKLDDETFEERIDEVELKLSKALTIAAGVFMLSFLGFPLVLICSDTMEKAGIDVGRAGNVIAVVAFVLSLALYLAIASCVVSLEKKINPEKNGNVFDVHFTKKWLGSMDEAELMKTARAAQKAYIAGVISCMIMWVISLISMFVFHTGIMPIICITVIMMVMVITGEIKAR